MSQIKYLPTPTLPIKAFIALLGLIFSLSASAASAASTPDKVPLELSLDINCEASVSSTEGPISGYQEEKAQGKVCTYKGVPFAKAPIKNLRWKLPQAAESRSSNFEALSYGPDCMQSKKASDLMIISSAKEISEDCLYLNIWRPRKAGNYPVMVWIHGGNLLMGSGAWPIYDGTNLAAKQDIVVVTINYRLGAFGYLSHNALVDKADGFEGGSAGNYGLLDQKMALKWIGQNIASFSGDPNNLTIFGESAGGWSVFNLLSSSNSEGLFHKAISQSGGSESLKPSEEAFEIGIRLAKQLKCDDKKLSSEEIGQCLREVPAKIIMEKSLGMYPRCMMTFNPDESACFLPRIDGTLLPKKSLDSLKDGQYLKIPIIAGYNSKDFGSLKRSTIESLNAMQGHPKFLYKFRYKKSFINIHSSGAHGAEVPFVFDTLTDFNVLFGNISLYSDENLEDSRATVNSIQAYWANFARTGNPNGQNYLGEELPFWPQYENGKYLKIYNKISAED